MFLHRSFTFNLFIKLILTELKGCLYLFTIQPLIHQSYTDVNPRLMYPSHRIRPATYNHSSDNLWSANQSVSMDVVAAHREKHLYNLAATSDRYFDDLQLMKSGMRRPEHAEIGAVYLGKGWFLIGLRLPALLA